jgi:hypothetical protein
VTKVNIYYYLSTIQSIAHALRCSVRLPQSLTKLFAKVFFGFCSGSLIINTPNNTANNTYDALPVVWTANPLRFPPVNGFLILANQTEAWWVQNQLFFPDGMPNLILVDFYPRERPYVEQRLTSWAAKWKPSAGVFMGGTHYSRSTMKFHDNLSIS